MTIIQNIVNLISGSNQTPATRKETTRGFNVIAAKNIPIPHAPREWDSTRNIADLPSVVGGVSGTSGPSRTMYAQPILNPNFGRGFGKRVRVPAARDLKVGEANFAIDGGRKFDGIERGSKRARAAPHRTKAERIASTTVGGDGHNVALDGRTERPRGFHASDDAGMQGLFGESLLTLIPHRINQFLERF